MATNLSAVQNGEQIDFTFDATTGVSAVWLSLEYWNGTSYQQIPAADITGVDYKVGYQAGRVVTGNGKALSWTGAEAAFANTANSAVKLRCSFHGNDSSTVESGLFFS